MLPLGEGPELVGVRGVAGGHGWVLATCCQTHSGCVVLNEVVLCQLPLLVGGHTCGLPTEAALPELHRPRARPQAQLFAHVVPQVPLRRVLKVLVAPHPVARIHDERLPPVVVLPDVQAAVGALVLNRSVRGRVEVGDEHLGVDVLQVPREVLAVQPLPQPAPFCNVTIRLLSGHLCSLLVPPVEDLLVVIHPDLGQADLVPGDDLRALGEGVGALGAEDVAHNGAGDDLQLTPTLPDPERHFHVLSPPDLHLVVVGTDVLKV